MSGYTRGQVERLTDAELNSRTWPLPAPVLAHIRALQAENERLDHAADACMKERDEAEEQADTLADCIARLLGIDIGEHSSGNAPWQNAIDAAEYELDVRLRAALSGGRDE